MDASSSSKPTISFSLKGGKKERLQTQLQTSETVADYVSTTTELSARLKPEAPRPQVVIPIIHNSWRHVAVPADMPALESSTPKGESNGPKDESNGPKDESNGDSAKNSSAPMSLEEQAVKELMDAGKKGSEVKEHMPVPILIRNRVPGSENLKDELQKFKLDLTLRPDDNKEDTYMRVSVEDFGKGMLLGMGWVPGEGIGLTNKVLVQPVTFLNRGARLGLGADPSVLPQKKQKKYIKPGEQREEQPKMRPAPDADGRSRSYMKANDRLIPVHSQKLRVGALVEIRTGSHSQLYGRVMDFKEIKDDPNGDSLCSVKLQINEEVVPIKHSQFQIVDEHALPRDHPALLSSAEMQKRIEQDNAFLNAANAVDLLNGGKKDAKDKKDRKRSRSPQREKENSKSKKNRSRSRSSESKKSSSSSSNGGSSSNGSSSSSKKISWVTDHIRVRVINRKLGGGKFYNLKGRVEDITSATEFTVVMDGTGQVLEGIIERDVESALPKVGGSVKMLRGAHKGETGKLLERNSETSIAAVQLEAELEIIKASFDDIAEHVA